MGKAENIRICHACKDYSQTQRPGGCHGPCPCHWDGKDIKEHAKGGYCPMGKFPTAGIGSLLTKFIWWSGASRIAKALKVYDPKKCGCAKRQAKLNGQARSE